MVSKSKNNAQKAANPYTQSAPKVKKKEVKDKVSSDNIETKQPGKKPDTVNETKQSDERTENLSKDQSETDSKVEKKTTTKTDQTTSETKDGKKENLAETQDTSKIVDPAVTDQTTEKGAGKSKASSRKTTASKESNPKEYTTGKSKETSKQDQNRENKESSTQQKQKEEKAMSSKTSVPEKADKKGNKTESEKATKGVGKEKRSKPIDSDKASNAVESDRSSKAAESDRVSKAAESDRQSKAAESEKASKPIESEKKKHEEEEESDSSDDSDDSEEEESDGEEDPLIAKLASKYNLKVEEPEIQKVEQEEEEQERLLTAKSNVVDLGSLSLRYNTKYKSALQPILVDYGLPDPYAEQEYKRAEKIKKKKMKKSKSVEEDRGTEKRQLHARDFENAQRLRELMNEDYLEKLQERVAQQRIDIKKRSDELEQKLLNMEQKKRDSMKFEKRLQRHDLTHDATALRAIPKSNAYKMIGLEAKLLKSNKLKSREEMEEFWECADDEMALREYIKRQGIGASPESKKSSSEHQSSSHFEDSFTSSRTSSMSSITQEKEHTVDFARMRTLTQIEEMKEPSRPSTRDANADTPWAVTQLSPAKHGKRTPSPSKSSRSLSPMKTNLSVSSSPTRKSQDPHIIAKQAAAELDKKHPMKELPPLNCFAVDMNEATQDPEELLKDLQQNRREKERKLFVKRIRSMYQRSKANIASTNRIMDKRYDDFTLDDEAAPTDTWLSSYDLEPVKAPVIEPVHPDIQYMMDRPWLKHIRRRAIVTIVEESEPPSGVQSQKTSASLVRQRPTSRDLPTRPSSIYSYQPTTVPALSMAAVENNSKVLESKCLSSLWTNYLGVGKSVAA